MPTNFFISHASEDKAAIARPLADSLRACGHSVWYDDYTLRLGDSLPQEIDRGLAACRYGIVILSPAFFAKQWPRRELDGLVAREVSERAKHILPVWHGVDQHAVARFSPTLAARLAVSTEKGLDEVVRRIVAVLEVPPANQPIPTREASIRDAEPGELSSLNVPPGYERRLSLHLARVARDKAARNPAGGYTYPVAVKGPDAQVGAFAREVAKRFGAQPMVTRSSNGVGGLEFTFSGEHGPEAMEDLAIKHRLTIIKCGNRFSL